MNNTQYSEIGQKLSPPIISDLMAKALNNPSLLSIAAGFTDNVILPNHLISEGTQDLLQKNISNDVLQYGTTQGRLRLREEVLKHLNSYPSESVDLESDNVLISNGSQQSLYLCMQVLCNPGDIILVEDPSYFVFLEMLQGLNIQAIGMPSDNCGKTDIDKTRKLIHQLKEENRWNRVKGAYLVSYYSNPSSRSLPLDEKIALCNLFKDTGLNGPIIEDAAYRDLYYDAPHPAPSLLSMAEAKDCRLLYTSTFTKPLATGLKVGYSISNDPELLQKMIYCKGHHDFGTANFNQALIEQILVKGLYPELLRKQQTHYKDKAIVIHEELRQSGIAEFGWKCEKPMGGLLLWLIDPLNRVDTSMNSEFCNACLNAGVLYVPGDLCFASQTPKSAMRLSFGTLKPEDLRVAIQRLCDVIQKYI
jgi:2-aminoadipate transaminase